MMATAVTNLKEEAHRIVDRLPANATWDDLMREIYERQVIEESLADSEAGRTVQHAEVMAKYGIVK